MIDRRAAASSTDVLPNQGENDSVLTAGAAEGVIASVVEKKNDEPISPFVKVSHLQTPTSYHMHPLPARLRDVGVDENTLQQIREILR